MGDILLIALGNEAAGDEAAAIQAARCLSDPDVDIVVAGRPGDRLIDLLDTALPVVVADVIRSGANPGHIHQMRLSDVVERAGQYPPISADHLAPAEAFRRAEAKGRHLPEGLFLGIEGVCFEPLAALSPQVELCFEELVAALRGAISALREREIDKHRPPQ
jgi:hydrogenase maturation protease